MKTRSVQRRVLGLVMAVVAAVWALAAVFTAIDTRHELDELLDAHLAQAAGLLLAQQAHELQEQEDLQALVLHPYASRVIFQVFAQGELKLKSANAPRTPLVDSPTPVTGFRSVPIEGVPWRVFGATTPAGDVQVFVGEEIASRTSILRAVLGGTLGPMALALPLLAVAAWWAIAKGLAPLLKSRDEIARRSADDFSPLRLQDTPAELLPMLQALNQLFERIGRLMEGERRFTADAAHELRTPISAIRAQAQVASREPDAGLRQHALEQLMAGCDRASRLVDQLLVLARMEGEGGVAFESVALGELVRSTVAEQAGRAIDRHQELALEVQTSPSVRGVPLLLALVVRNLVDNAIRYGGEGSTVRVRVRPEGGRVLLEVDDSGPGLAEADIARLGQRFFRVPGQEASGSGLGWSIVQRIAEIHGASLAARKSDLGGLGVTVALRTAQGGAAANSIRA